MRANEHPQRINFEKKSKSPRPSGGAGHVDAGGAAQLSTAPRSPHHSWEGVPAILRKFVTRTVIVGSAGSGTVVTNHSTATTQLGTLNEGKQDD